MEARFIRIKQITIENFKNVKYGTLDLENKRKDYKASMVGIYGQNGSGKTALIDAVVLLKLALCGQSIPLKYADYIHVDAKYATLSYQFQIQQDEQMFDVWYSFRIQKVIDDTSLNMEEDPGKFLVRAELYDEVLSFSLESKSVHHRKNTLIDTRTKDVFLPKAKYLELVGKEKQNTTEMLVTKRVVQKSSRSFVFSREMMQIFQKNCQKKEYLTILEGLMWYGNRELFVLHTEHMGLINSNTLPLTFKYTKEHSDMVGNITIPLDAPVSIPEEALGVVMNVLNNMNIVLEQIVPGLTIGIKELAVIAFQDAKPGKTIQLMSQKNGTSIPFQYESEGIKKIVSILQLLIVVYNQPSITVAIDEIDSGIFEYLLGELLKILSEKGKGQLLFTSHNLRPLETIDKGFIAFTTTNPQNRYMRMVNVKGNHNLRDFYYRDIVLGEQSEQVYEATNNFEIALAFREAGDFFGT